MKLAYLLLLSLFIISPAFSASSIIIGVRESGLNTYEGVIAQLEVSVKQGSNHVYIDTMPLTEIDTQASARLAREVACEMLNVDCSSKDFFYTIRGEFPMIGGPSAGAAMAVLTMCELSNIKNNPLVAMTGTVNPDGSVGSIGGLLEKSVAASNYGITTFLIPLGQISDIGNYTFPNNMSIVEVSTVRQAYSYFTGTIFEEIDDTIDLEEFNNMMKPLSESLMNYSNNILNEAVLQYELSNLTFENNLIINLMLNSSMNQQEQMNDFYSNNNYYSAASYAVGLGVNVLYATYLINYLENNNTDYVNSLIGFADNELKNFEEQVNKPFTLNHVNDLEAVNIAVDRFFEAKQLYLDAANNYIENDMFSALYNIAFVHMRLKTAESWLGLKESFNNNINIEFTQELLQELALERIENTNTMITYAESTEESSYTVNAREQLETSRKAYDEGNYIYSIFESLRALSNANLGMQLRGVTLEQVTNRIELSKTQARQNINLVQSNGLMPILALSYYEYALSFEEDSPAQALTFLEYSKQFSLLSFQMVNNIDSSLTKPLFDMPSPEEVGAQVSIVIIGLIIGACLTLLMLYRILI